MSSKIKLLFDTPSKWTDGVIAEFDSFLIDHAACEKKASSMAMTMAAHYTDKSELVGAMIDLAIEELTHYRDVFKLLQQRNLQIAPDEKDPYVNQFRQHIRRGPDVYLLDRLLIAGIVEARGHERFGLVADALTEGALKRFYMSITASEERHAELFVDLALRYLPEQQVYERLNQLLDAEASIAENLPLRPALH